MCILKHCLIKIYLESLTHVPHKPRFAGAPSRSSPTYSRFLNNLSKFLLTPYNIKSWLRPARSWSASSAPTTRRASSAQESRGGGALSLSSLAAIAATRVLLGAAPAPVCVLTIEARCPAQALRVEGVLAAAAAAAAADRVQER